MQQISAELEKRLGTAVEKMPPFPKSVQRVLELTRDINCRPKDLVEVIEKDPIITIKVLKIINSAYYGLTNKITSINQTVIYLGANTLKNLALSFSTVGILPNKNDAGFDIHHYLVSSLVTAGIVRLLGTQYAPGDADPTDCYVAGLLHDFGKVVFAVCMPEEFSQALALSANEHIPLHKAEKAVIGADHTVVGAMLVKRWQFPEPLVECIAGHHDRTQSSAMGECLHAADLIAERLGYDSNGRVSTERSAVVLAKRFGGDIDAVMAKLGDLSKIIDEAQMFSRSEGT
ncbi:MAG: HDOD domain-containing protein [Betaproteobacteria bacterium]|nr:HDOD domain-containing protein [Betaproteobacteria bacterium]